MSMLTHAVYQSSLWLCDQSNEEYPAILQIVSPIRTVKSHGLKLTFFFYHSKQEYKSMLCASNFPFYNYHLSIYF